MLQNKFAQGNWIKDFSAHLNIWVDKQVMEFKFPDI